MANDRPASVAGTFYPADAPRLRDQIDAFLEDAASVAQPEPGRARAAGPTSASTSAPPASTSAPPASTAAPRALIAPHAGYVYSGPIAASAFVRLRAADPPNRVVVIGPSHFVPFDGVALPGWDAFSTPLGRLPVQSEGRAQALQVDGVIEANAPHAREHAIEVELPFLQAVLGDIEVVPLVTGRATPRQVADVLEALWDGRTLLVVSSDLSHFHDYDTARRLDAATAAAIVGGRPQDLGEGSACGRLAIQGMLLCAARRGAVVDLLDLRNSGDTAGPRDEVVGYGAFAC